MSATPDSITQATSSNGSGSSVPTPGWHFSDPAVRRDPYPFFAQLRREMPVFHMDLGRRGTGFFVSRYEDVLAVMKDTERFANDKRNAGGSISWIESRLSMGMTDAMVMRDGADHRRLRTLAHMAFTPMRVAALENRIEELTNKLLDAAEARGADGAMDAVTDLALPLPIAVISEMMGVEEKHHKNFHKWMNGILELDGAGALEVLTNIPNLIKLNRFLRGLIAERRAHKGDDVLSALVDAEEQGDRLSFNELVASTLIILLAGHETTVNLIGSGLLALIKHPEQLERLRAQPELMDSAVEEFLRYTSPVQINAPRFAREDTEIGGVRIPRGAAVSTLLGSANHDENHFTDPDQLDVGRTPNRHLAFGYGVHFCLGAPLARLETKAVFRVLLRRYRSFELAAPAAELKLRRSLSVRGLLSLPIRAHQ